MSRNRVENLNFFERCCLEIVWAICWLVARLPHYVLYNIFARFIYFMLYRVIGYRRGVVDDNLTRSFPEKSAEEIASIRQNFYVVLSEVMVSTVALANTQSSRGIFPTMGKNLEDETCAKYLYDKTMGRDRSWIALTTHFGLWEYLPSWSAYADQLLFAVYHPLQNRIFDELFKRLRSYGKISTLPATEMVRLVVKNGNRYDGQSYALGLLADQNPPLLPDSHWFTFLGQDTIFFEGGEKLALRASLPVYFTYQRRTGRGRYEFCYKDIWDGEEKIEAGVITQRYVALLEEQIRLNPYMWLWSHRRWKAKRTHREAWMEALTPEK